MAFLLLLIDAGKLLGLIFLLIAALVTVLLLDSLIRGWWQCRCMRVQNPQLPPALHFEKLRQASFTIRGCFAAAEDWFRHEKQWSLELLPNLLCVRRFVLVANQELLTHILVTKQSRYEKHHAYGILERFRCTTLPTSGVDAWKETHRLISKFGKALPLLEAVLTPLIDEWMDTNWKTAAHHHYSNDHSTNGHTNGTANGCYSNGAVKPTGTVVAVQDTAETLRNMYWKVVMILVLGDNDSAEAARDYKEAWTTCMERLDSPQAFMFWWAQYLPTPLNLRYKTQTTRLRNRVRRAVNTAWDQTKNDAAEWSFLQMMQEEQASRRLSREDATEVLLEILFTGASSVTTTLLWLLWLLATHPQAQERVAKEVQSLDDSMLSLTPNSSKQLPFLESCIRETLRLYSPIHVGRHCIEDDRFGDICIPKGTDVAANMWFIHRNAEYWENPTQFQPERYMDQPNNVPYYHPFSMGIRGCPGKTVAYAMIKYVVARVLRKYELSPVSGMPTPDFSGSVVLSNTPIHIYLDAKPRRTSVVNNGDAY